MKRILTVILLVSGTLAAGGRVMRKLGRVSSIRSSGNGLIGVIGQADHPKVLFAAKREVPVIARDCRIRFFHTVMMLSAVLLQNLRGKKGSAVK